MRRIDLSAFGRQFDFLLAQSVDAPERLPEVAEGVVFGDGVREKRGNEKAAA